MHCPAWLQLIRPRQWVKNVFVLAPLIFSFKLTSIAAIAQASVAAVIFCLTASVVYIVNDLSDMEADRQHPQKSSRPLAAGTLSSRHAVIVALILSCLVAVIGFSAFDTVLGKNFYFTICAYLLISLLYCGKLKCVPLLELMIVASGYVLRLLAGCAALDVQPSPWILAATGSVALLLTAGKRRTEIAEAGSDVRPRLSLSAYNLPFLDHLITMLAAVTVVTYLLFTTSDYAIERFHNRYLVGTAVFVLYGITRYLQRVFVLTGAGDPTTLVLTDLHLRWTVLGWAATCIVIIYA